MPSPSLTSHLLSQTNSPAYIAATNHPFLKQAGEGTLPASTLAHWLYQDRIYASHAYPRFVGLLIAKIPFETRDLASFRSEVTRAESVNRQILECLSFSLVNIVQEVKFFETTAGSIEVQNSSEIEIERLETRNYTAEMARVASLGTLEEGLVFLWAMEKMYLDAWTFASKQTGQSRSKGLDAFITNWTSDAFKKFVDDLEKLVNLLGIEPGSDSWRRAEVTWNRVIELEEGFWPKV
ncbi:TENA/THI-4 family protein [Rhizoctonia solani 123E]|uniref:TENA/THI-4 family protein n=1 Tax=Rhizoctonia solani 123E TaxID=1423351 RepID=A0A074S184_9AGAM|nr:TENA/THI-4 family protein [Rhizoctonia solani 123E]